jgi:cellobiose phosphorylase
MVIVGVGQAEVEGRAAVNEFASSDAVHAALQDLKQHWHSRLTSLSVATADAELDSILNVWNPYNCLITFAWSRAASLIYSGERDGLGYRDTVQDMLGVLAAIPDEAEQRLKLMLTGQLSTGGALPVIKPFAHRPGEHSPPDELQYRSDDCLWLFDTVPAYVKETGNLDFFAWVLPYADQGNATVLGHLRRALEFNLKRRGAHGLPCGLSADWNDTLRLGHRGESAFVAFQLRHALRVYADIALRLGRQEERSWALAQLSELDAAIQAHAWNGRWFLRGYLEDGTPLGAAECAEGSIFLNPQVWAVLSGAATKEQAIVAMDAVAERLATPFGALICDPPFIAADPNTVRAPLFNPGMKENAGIFCHPQGWLVMAEAQLGNGNRAYAYLRAYLPSAFNARAELRQIEPYVHCQSTHGRASRRFGASRLPWLTGTAAWSYYAATQSILGIRPDYDGLRIDPVIPEQWPGFTVTRQFRGATYNIKVDNQAHVQSGIGQLLFNGSSVDPGLPLPLAPRGSRATVEAVLGR